MNRQRGFSLLELLIVVAIIGIIAAIAYPSYQESVRKSRRADCSGALAALSNAMERFYTVNTTYLGAAAAGADSGAPAISGTTCPSDGSAATYNLTILPSTTASTYALQATPTGAQTGDKCGSLTLTNTGLKGVTGAKSGITWDQCW